MTQVLSATTLAGDITATQLSITLASGTLAAVKNFVKIDSEFMQIQDNSQSPVLLVQRGQNGTSAEPHASGATAAVGAASAFPMEPVIARTYTYGSSGAILVAPGTHILKGPSGSVTMTLADPTPAQNGFVLAITAATSEAYTVSNAAGSGFNGGGSGSDVATYNAIGDTLTIEIVNGVYNVVGNVGVTLG